MRHRRIGRGHTLTYSPISRLVVLWLAVVAGIVGFSGHASAARAKTHREAARLMIPICRSTLGYASHARLRNLPFDEMSAADLLSKYDGANAEGRECVQLVVGYTENGLSWANAYLQHKGEAPLYCQPERLALTAEQSIDILRRYVNDHPAARDKPFGLGLFDALQETFTCPAAIDVGPEKSTNLR